MIPTTTETTPTTINARSATAMADGERLFILATTEYGESITITVDCPELLLESLQHALRCKREAERKKGGLR